MNRENRGILYGMSLGDGNMYIATNNFGAKYVPFCIAHGPSQKEYLEYKADLLHKVFGGIKPKVHYRKTYNKKLDKEYDNYYLKKVDKYFKQMHRVLYGTGQKRYTRQILDYVTDHGLALWFMDDGSKSLVKNKEGKTSSCVLRLATYCSEEEAQILKQWFIDRYDVEAKFDLDKRNNKYSLRFTSKPALKLIEVMKPFIPDCMKYKIDFIQECGTTLDNKVDDIV